MSSSRPVALVTGACGGIGQACCRLLGQSHDLVLTDIRDEPLVQFAEALGREGHEVLATAAGDLSDETVAASIVEQARSTGRLSVVVHTAGLSPALADWRKIFWANFVATGRLLDALEADLPAGLSCVAISSMAGHTAVPVPELDDLFAAPVSGQTIGALENALAAMEDPDNPGQLGYEVYGQTKRAVIRMAQARCIPWGKKAARINTISPGLIRTPMGTAEVEIAPQVRTLITAAPMGRWGTPIDIAQAAAFLVSDQASFVTGADLRVDGGVTPALTAASR